MMRNINNKDLSIYRDVLQFPWETSQEVLGKTVCVLHRSLEKSNSQIGLDKSS